MHANAPLRGGGWARMWVRRRSDQIRRRQEWLVAGHDALAAALGAG